MFSEVLDFILGRSLPVTSNPLGVGGPTPTAPPAPVQKGYDDALAFVLLWEGGKVDDPDDAGGRTNCGVTQAEFDHWRDARGVPRGDVFNITPAEVSNIYRSDYWQAGRAFCLQWPLALVHFDTSVLFGPARALSQFLAQTVDPLAYLNLRRDYHKKRVETVPSQAKFLAGWLNRCDALEREIKSCSPS